MHLRGWCDAFSSLFGVTDQVIYMRCKRALGGLLPPSPRGHGRDLAPHEVVRALVIGVIPSRGGEWLAQAERLLAARAFTGDPRGGWIATGETETFEQRLTTALTKRDGLDGLTTLTITGLVPWAEVTFDDGRSTLFAPSPTYRAGRRLHLGAEAVHAAIFSRSALETIAQKMSAEQGAKTRRAGHRENPPKPASSRGAAR